MPCLLLQGTINRLEQEKGKLENYAKRTLTAFKDKYMAALQGMKQEKRSLEERLALVTAKSEHNQETSRREERLLISAMYEVSTRTSFQSKEHGIQARHLLTFMIPFFD